MRSVGVQELVWASIRFLSSKIVQAVSGGPSNKLYAYHMHAHPRWTTQQRQNQHIYQNVWYLIDTIQYAIGAHTLSWQLQASVPPVAFATCQASAMSIIWTMLNRQSSHQQEYIIGQTLPDTFQVCWINASYWNHMLYQRRNAQQVKINSTCRGSDWLSKLSI